MSSMNAITNDISKKAKNGLELSLPFGTNATRQEGRTISLQTNGKQTKRVFIPKGWMFCTIAPPKCYSSLRKKSKMSSSVIKREFLLRPVYINKLTCFKLWRSGNVLSRGENHPLRCHGCHFVGKRFCLVIFPYLTDSEVGST